MQPSPYTPGTIAPELPAGIISSLSFNDRLSLMADLRRFVGWPRVDNAPRGLGNTSMFAEARRMAEGRGAVTIWGAGDGNGQLIADIAS